jgi:hypothetical protein
MNTPITESDLAAALGVPPELLATLRRTIPLTMPLHFTRTPEIVYSDAGLAAILEKIGAEEKDCTDPEIAELRIVRKVTNQHIVLAEKKEGGGGCLTLKVPTYSDGTQTLNHFRPGQVCKARHVEGATWSYHGPRPQHPRDARAFVSF